MMDMRGRTAAMVALAAGVLAVAACSTPSPAVPAVDLGQTGNTASAPPVPTAAPTRDTLDGEYAVAAGDAAGAVFAVNGDAISVVEVTGSTGWRQVEDARGSREIRMVWVRDTDVVSLDVEIDDGRFEADVAIETVAAPGPSTHRVGDAGSVTIEVIGDRVALVGQESAPGWVATVDEAELAGGEVEIRFRADGAASAIDFDTEVDDGRLTIDIDTQTGRDYAAPPVR